MLVYEREREDINVINKKRTAEAYSQELFLKHIYYYGPFLGGLYFKCTVHYTGINVTIGKYSVVSVYESVKYSGAATL